MPPQPLPASIVKTEPGANEGSTPASAAAAAAPPPPPLAPARPTLLDLYRHPPPERRTIGSTSSSINGAAAAASAARGGGGSSCHCKRSNCLKLYCECFANGVYCARVRKACHDAAPIQSSPPTQILIQTTTNPDSQSRGCRCEGCYNNADGEATRREAIELILDRNPHGFRPKIVMAGGVGATALGGGQAAPGVKAEEGGEAGGETRHQKGCHCKRSHCRKKYCECFQAGIACTGACFV